VNVLLVATYELGRQPFGVASPAAWLRREGCRVSCVDLAVERLHEEAVVTADLIAFHLPMHTATRLAARVVGKVRAINPGAHLCFYGLYAPGNADYLRKLGGQTILGGEFEEGLLALVRRLASKGVRGSGPRGDGQPEAVISLSRQQFLSPDRSGLPGLGHYAHLHMGHDDLRAVGYTEASRGCRHLCRHCPIVPIYEGTFRIVQREVVLADVRQQVEAGARHITFGDPDFLNGPKHAVAIVQDLHREFVDLTYDVTIKIEHILKYRESLPVLRDTGCLFITSAVEAVDDRVLEILHKGHTRAGFEKAVELCREARVRLNPTFVTFTPWISREGYLDLLQAILDLDLVDHVAPIQYAIRLLIPAGSKLLELPEVRAIVGPFQDEKLIYPWVHSDARVDGLYAEVLCAVQEGQRLHEDRRGILQRVWRLARAAVDRGAGEGLAMAELDRIPRAAVPYLTEPWYC